MIYYSIEDLPVITVSDLNKEINIYTAANVLLQYRVNTICILCDGKYAGIVTAGDLLRAKRDQRETVRMNASGFFVDKDEVMKARTIFKERKNIHFLPVVHEQVLLGGYSRFDDVLLLKHFSGWKENAGFISSIRKIPKVYIIDPVQEEKRKIADFWYQQFQRYHHAEYINPEQIEDMHPGEFYLFTDEDERRAVRTYLEVAKNIEYKSEQIMTFYDLIRETADSTIEVLLEHFRKNKIHPIFLYTENLHTEYMNKLSEHWVYSSDIAVNARRVLPSQGKGFYQELYTEDYYNQVGNHMFTIEKTNSFIRLKDESGPYFTIRSGKRVTVDAPAEAKTRIHFFGPCIAIGPYVEDRYTLESRMQKLLNEKNISAEVVNHGTWEDLVTELIHIVSTPVYPEEIVVLYFDNRHPEGYPAINLMNLLEEYHVPKEYLLDSPLHCNHIVYQYYAEALTDLVIPMIRESQKDADQSIHEKQVMDRNTVKALYTDRFFHHLHFKEGEVVGAICMHANPFTDGHRYLIEEALKQTDKLIVFIIEEELGIFTYPERYHMAAEAVKDLPNVYVGTSGPFQATRNIFPEYFIRIEASQVDQGAIYDSKIFGIIAGLLHITKRFVGDENHNPKMQRFNYLLKETLSEYGVEVIEIPRKETEGHIISASVSREIANAGDREKLSAFVPPSTIECIFCEGN